jgi:hypothetical protein
MDSTNDEPEERPAPTSLKQRILERFEAGTTSVSAIARAVRARPSYVASVLLNAGYEPSETYYDLYSSFPPIRDAYERFFRHQPQWTSRALAVRSVASLERNYNYFERLGDHAGMHRAMMCALIGYNRARNAGKRDASIPFAEFLHKLIFTD